MYMVSNKEQKKKAPATWLHTTLEKSKTYKFMATFI